METVAFSEDMVFGLNGPELAVLGVLAVGTYYIGKKVFRTLSGQAN